MINLPAHCPNLSLNDLFSLLLGIKYGTRTALAICTRDFKLSTRKQKTAHTPAAASKYSQKVTFKTKSLNNVNILKSLMITSIKCIIYFNVDISEDQLCLDHLGTVVFGFTNYGKSFLIIC